MADELYCEQVLHVRASVHTAVSPVMLHQVQGPAGHVALLKEEQDGHWPEAMSEFCRQEEDVWHQEHVAEAGLE